MEYLLGIDVGTSGTKTVLFDLDGRPTASETLEYPLYQEHNGWAEQEPEDWWNAASLGIKAVLNKAGISPEAVLGIGLSGQMHGLVMLDKDGKILRRSIIWCDQRTGDETEEMNRLVTPEKILSETANPALTGFTASKILWVKKHEPEIYGRCAHILLPKDYIRFKLTGEYATEVSDASGMQLMNIEKRTWSEVMLSGLGIDRSMLGKLYESPDITGCVTKEAAELTGLRAGTPVAGGAGDNPATAIGTGVAAQGMAFTTLGTSAVVYAVSDRMRLDPQCRVHTLCASVPGKWTVMSCTQAAGLSLQWLRNNFSARQGGEKSETYDQMTALAEESALGSNRLIYLPYLMGERSPHPDPDCRGVFFGLSAVHTRGDLIRAVIEGVSFSQWECVEVFREMGVPVNKMIACGGGARSSFWRQMLSDMYGCPVSSIEADQGGALGAAVLAGVGTGVYDSLESACAQLVHIKDRKEPNLKNHKAYAEYFALYKDLYRTLYNSFRELKKLP